MGWLSDGRHPTPRRPASLCSESFQVSGGGHQGLSISGLGSLAFSNQAPAISGARLRVVTTFQGLCLRCLRWIWLLSFK